MRCLLILILVGLVGLMGCDCVVTPQPARQVEITIYDLPDCIDGSCDTAHTRFVNESLVILNHNFINGTYRLYVNSKAEINQVDIDLHCFERYGFHFNLFRNGTNNVSMPKNFSSNYSINWTGT